MSLCAVQYVFFNINMFICLYVYILNSTEQKAANKPHISMFLCVKLYRGCPHCYQFLLVTVWLSHERSNQKDEIVNQLVHFLSSYPPPPPPE